MAAGGAGMTITSRRFARGIPIHDSKTTAQNVGYGPTLYCKVAKLTALGLDWVPGKWGDGRPDVPGWEAQLARLAAYKEARGDCSVPCSWAEDPRLGSWVKSQREFKKVLDRGEPSRGMMAARAAKLEALGFAWELSRR